MLGDTMILETMNEINNVTKGDFSIVIAKSHGCGVCNIAKKQLEIILKDLDIPLYEVYIDDVPEYRGAHLVFTVPTVSIFSNNKEMLRESRFINLNKIERIIKLNLN